MSCKGNTYGISMGCCQPVLAPIENYYTKYEIDKLIENIEVSGGCCITEEEVDDKIEAAKTEIESEIPSLNGYATEQWVENKGYLTEHQHLKTINNQTLVGNGNIVISGDTDLSDYYTKQEVNSLIPTVPTSNTAFTNDAGYITSSALNGYATTSDVQSATNDMATKTWVGQQGYLTQHQDLSNYALKEEIPDISGKQDVSGMTAYTQTTAFTAHTANTTVHVTSSEKNTWNSKVDSSTLNNYLLKSKIWCGTEAQYNSISNKDSETLYLIHG